MKNIATATLMTTGLLLIAYTVAAVLTGGIAPYPATYTFYATTPLHFFGVLKAGFYIVLALILSVLAGMQAKFASTIEDGMERIRRTNMIFFLVCVAAVSASLAGVLIFGGMWHIASTLLLGVASVVGVTSVMLFYWVLNE